MTFSHLRFFLAVAAVLPAAGCASFRTTVEPGRDLAAYERIFVERNHTDDHGVAGQIAAALEARGKQVSFGPITMLPASAQLIIRYEDRWTWDFKTHMIALRISVVEAATMKPIAYGSFEGPTAATAVASQVIDRIVGDLFGPAKAPSAPASP